MTKLEDAALAKQAETHGLHRDLRLADLVSMQVLLVIGVTWTGNAARQGSAQMMFWLLGIAVFFIPLAMVVNFCVGHWPQEGGVYQWTKQAIGPWAGFLAAWNFGAYCVLLLASTGVITAAIFAYVAGQAGAWMANSTALIVTLNAVFLGFMLVTNIFGLGAGKWLGHIGTACVVLGFLLCATLLLFHPDATAAHPHLAPQPPVTLALPVLTLLSLNMFTKLTFNGLSGLEQVAVFAGETHQAKRNIRRSVWIAAPLLALIYIITTSALLDYTPAAQIDLVAPVPQLLTTAFNGGATVALRHWGGLLAAAVNVSVAVATVGQYGVMMAETSRLPMVAAWDHLLPAAFTRLHPRFRTPVLSLAVVAGGAFAFSLVASGGAGAAEAFQIIATSSYLCLGVYYVLLFGVPLICGTRFGRAPELRPSALLRLACVCGLALTLLAMAFALVPVVDVASTVVFALKIAGTALVINAVGGALYWRAGRKQVLF